MRKPTGEPGASTDHKQRLVQVEALSQLARDLTRASDAVAVANVLFAQGRQLLGADFGFLLLADSAGHTLRGVASAGSLIENFTQETIHVNEELGPAVLAFQQQQPIIVADRHSSPPISDRLRKQYHFVKSSCWMPLLDGQQPLGIFVLGYAARHQSTVEDLRLLEFLGHEAVLALTRIRAEEKVRESEKQHHLMFEKNRRTEAALAQTGGQYEALLNSLDSIVWECEARTFQFTFVSHQAERILGYPIEQWLRTPSFWQEHIHPDDRVRAVTICETNLKKKSEYAFEYRMVATDGRAVWLRDVVSVVREHGEPTVLRGIMIDISERKHAEETLRTLNADLEQRVAERTTALQQTIAELQQFVRLASHDLQEPLRMASSHVQLLASRYRGQLDAQADEWINTAVAGAKRLQRLVLDLLAYNEVSTQPFDFRPVDCSGVLVGTLADLRGVIAERGATVTYSALPTVWGDARMLQQVFRNLISNSIKFHGDAPPQIHISAERDHEHWRFAVQDNGHGVTAEDHERIFLPFQRLHTLETYPKPGIGLAICRKIIERHGGRIWVHSTPGQGATFFFTLVASAKTPLTPRADGHS